MTDQAVHTHAISSEALPELLKIVPPGSTVLELGTGDGTAQFAEHYEMISVENDVRWHTGHSQLIHVPLVSVASLGLPPSFYKRLPKVTNWYDPTILAEKLRGVEYDAIIIDGPSGTRTRGAMWWYYAKLFNIEVPVIVDDVHRHVDWIVAAQVVKDKGVTAFQVFYGRSDNNMFAVIV